MNQDPALSDQSIKDQIKLTMKNGKAIHRFPKWASREGRRRNFHGKDATFVRWHMRPNLIVVMHSAEEHDIAVTVLGPLRPPRGGIPSQRRVRPR